MAKRFYDCPIESTLEVIGGKWKTSVIYYLQEAPQRFSELMALLETCSAKVLTRQLRDLEKDGIIARNYYAEMPPRVEYALTAYGKTLLPLVDAICTWGEGHLERTGQRAVYN